MKLIKQAKWSYILISVATVCLGLLMILFPGSSTKLICRAFGIMLICFGVSKLLGYFSEDLYLLAFQFDLGLGIFCLVAGIVLVCKPSPMIAVLPVLIGTFVLIEGVFRIQTSIDAKRFGEPKWWMLLLMAVITCLAGILLILHPFAGADLIMVLAGITLVIFGIQNIIVIVFTVKVIKRASPVDSNGRYID